MSRSDVIVVGAGFAGCCAAHVLAERGYSVTLIDRVAQFPDIFRAEKIEPEQAALLDKFGLLEWREPAAGTLGTILNYRNGELQPFDASGQYAMHYSATVNRFRQALEGRATLIIDPVTELRASATETEVLTASGVCHTARFVVVACGGIEGLLTPLGITRRYQPSLVSLSFAFCLERSDEAPFPHAGFNYFPGGADGECAAGLDYITIFRMGEMMRANVFTQWDRRDPAVKAFRSDPEGALAQYFPELETGIGPYKITSRVQVMPTTFYRLRGVELPGIAVIGDDYQSVSPTTGTGLTKITVDVDRLCNHYLPDWLAKERIDAKAVASFYCDTVKQAADRESLGRWISYRDHHRGFWGQQASRVEWRINNALSRW